METMRVARASRWLGSALAALLLLASAVYAEEAGTNPPPASSNADRNAPPAREGNVYDHRSHQPTPDELGLAPPSASSRQQVDKEVQDLLKQASPNGTQAH